MHYSAVGASLVTFIIMIPFVRKSDIDVLKTQLLTDYI